MRQSSINWHNQDEVKAYRQAYYRKRKALKNLEEKPVEVTPKEEPKPRKKTVSVSAPNRGSDYFKTPYEKVSTQEAAERVLDKIFDAIVERGLQRPTVNVVNTADGVEVKVTYFKDCEITFGLRKGGVCFTWGKRYLSSTDIQILKTLDQNYESILNRSARIVFDEPFVLFNDESEYFDRLEDI